jgi:hypothetical protein
MTKKKFTAGNFYIFFLSKLALIPGPKGFQSYRRSPYPSKKENIQLVRT